VIDLGPARWPHEPVVYAVAFRDRVKLGIAAHQAAGWQWLAVAS
jgi:hypothetical protein